MSVELPSHVQVPRKVLANEIFTPEEWVSEMSALGCAITIAQYRGMILALGMVEHQGTHDRRPDKDQHGKFGPLPTDGDTGKPLQQDNEYDIAEVKLKRLLYTSLEKHVNLIRRGNCWPKDGFIENATVEPKLLPSQEPQA